MAHKHSCLISSFYKCHFSYTQTVISNKNYLLLFHISALTILSAGRFTCQSACSIAFTNDKAEIFILRFFSEMSFIIVILYVSIIVIFTAYNSTLALLLCSSFDNFVIILNLVFQFLFCGNNANLQNVIISAQI